MKIVIKETGKQEELTISRNGLDYSMDFIGNNGALSDGQFAYDDDQNVYLCSQDTFDWWKPVLAAHQEADDRIMELSSVHGSEKIQDIINAATVHCDLEDQPAYIMQALDEAFAGK